ncbi:hypothetical protein TL16_g01125 [Triparma laevis f. inornata]|uniref:HSF-type DNA-binding domain-containing protein n=1 Tax=Triparma laevis f. inornata TaxID=1714386 RepID=A0A9W6ZCU6_9STRA|nr:hypothetical protein TL16_g01125 [Triparma laevis f. inornata]
MRTALKSKRLPSGDAFRISDLARLEQETLPAHFRHSRFQSLVRQLNFYNFRKVNRERTFWVYKHPLFHRDRPQDLPLLRRKTCGSTPTPDKTASNTDKASSATEPPTKSRNTSSNSSSGPSQYSVPGYGHLHSTRSPSPTFSASDLDSSDDEDEKSKNKRSRHERSQQSLTVSNVAQQLEVYAKRHRTQSADVTPMFEDEEQAPKKKKRSASLPVSLSNSDTMKYHALTYDDEVDNNSGVKVEEDDEENTSTSSLSSPAARSPLPPHSSPHAVGVPFSSGGSVNSVSYKTPSASGVKSGISPHTNSALTRFCLSTPPTSVLSCPKGHVALTSLLNSNENLKLDFENYRSALSPRSSFSPPPSATSSREGDDSGVPEGLKDFTPFAANCLADTFKGSWEGGFGEEEVTAVKNAMRVWFRAAVVTQ